MLLKTLPVDVEHPFIVVAFFFPFFDVSLFPYFWTLGIKRQYITTEVHLPTYALGSEMFHAPCKAKNINDDALKPLSTP